MRARRREAEASRRTSSNPIADPRPDAAARIVAREEAAALAEALAALPDDTREVLTLFYREGQSVAQVAELLDLTEAAVRKRLSRARQSLRAAVLERVGETLKTSAPGAAFTAGILAALLGRRSRDRSRIDADRVEDAASRRGSARSSCWPRSRRFPAPPAA